MRSCASRALLEIARRVPNTMQDLTAVKGTPRALMERAGTQVLGAVRRGMEVPEAELPRFPKPLRWNKDADFDNRVVKLKAARDEAATRLNLDPGILCPREKLEAVARKNPRTIEEVASIDVLRRWQVEELGAAFVRALALRS